MLAIAAPETGRELRGVRGEGPEKAGEVTMIALREQFKLCRRDPRVAGSTKPLCGAPHLNHTVTRPSFFVGGLLRI